MTHGFRSWADKGDARFFTLLSEVGVFGQKAVARVDGVDAFVFGEMNDFVDVQIGIDRIFALADFVRFVGFCAEQGKTIFF